MSGYQVTIRESAATPGLASTINLAGAVGSYQSFVSTYANNAIIVGYVIDSANSVGGTGDQTGLWESGTGQFVTNTAGNFLLRTAVYDSSSGSNTFVNFTTNCYVSVNPLAQTAINAFGAISGNTSSIQSQIYALGEIGVI